MGRIKIRPHAMVHGYVGLWFLMGDNPRPCSRWSILYPFDPPEFFFSCEQF